MTDAPEEPAQVVPSDPASTPDAEVVPSNNDVTSADQSADPAPAPVEPEADDTPRKGRAQERIEDLVAERNAAKEYAEYWRERSLELMNQNRPQNQQLPEPEAPQVSDLPPTLDQFNFDQNAHAKAVAQWSADKVRSEVAKTLEQNASQQAQQALAQAFQERVETFKESHPDFDIVMANPRLPQLDRLAAVMIVNSEHGAAISYELGKDPALATRISRMTAAQQALAIGRLETKVSQPTSPKPVVTAPAPAPTPKAVAPIVTKAPEPPTPIPSGGTPQVTPENMDVKEWMRARVGEVRSRRRGY